MPETVLLVIAIVSGLGALGWGADRFVEGASGLARRFGVPPIIIGLTAALYLMARGLRNSGYGSIVRWEGFVLVAVFAAYQMWIFLATVPVKHV